MTNKKSEQPHILVVDDDRRIRTLVARYLQDQNFIVMMAEHAAEAKGILARFDVDLMVLDVMMPGQSGVEFAQELRQGGGAMPILLLTALGEIDDKITGLEAGADDYLTKPFEPKELVLRIQSILRRAAPEKAGQKQFKIGAWVFNPAHDEIIQGEEVTRLTAVEANLLRALAESVGEVVSRDDLAQRCDLDAGERTIDVQVTRLRRKIEQDTKNPRHLHTVRGKGYLLRAERF